MKLNLNLKAGMESRFHKLEKQTGFRGPGLVRLAFTILEIIVDAIKSGKEVTIDGKTFKLPNKCND